MQGRIDFEAKVRRKAASNSPMYMCLCVCQWILTVGRGSVSRTYTTGRTERDVCINVWKMKFQTSNVKCKQHRNTNCNIKSNCTDNLDLSELSLY